MILDTISRGPLREEAGDNSGGGGGGTTTLAPEGGESGIPNNWRESVLPEDIRTDPSLADFKPGKEGLADLAKSYVHSRKMLGQPKVAIPKPDAPQAEWEAYYNAGGRPETVDGYKLQLPETKNVQVDDEKLGEWKKFFHEAGLSNKQANQILERYLTGTDQQADASNAAQQAQIKAADEKLRDDWGDNYEGHKEIAIATVKKFADEGFVNFLNSTGLGNHPEMIRLFHKVGENFMDDRASGAGPGLIVTNETKAKREIEVLKGDKDFMSTLTNKQAPGHNVAKQRWHELHQIAHPMK